MEINDSLMIFVIVLELVVLATAWFIGRMFDPTYRVKRLRQFLKTNTIMVGVVTKDRKTIDKIAVNVDNARVQIGSSIISVNKSKIYREDKPQDGFFIKKEHIKWEEGVPTLYIYADSLKPADFFTEPSNVSAEDVGTVLISFVRIEIMKGLAKIAEYKTYFMVIGGLLVLVGIGVFLIYGQVETTQKLAQACVGNTQLIMDKFGIVAGNATANNTITYKG